MARRSKPRIKFVAGTVVLALLVLAASFLSRSATNTAARRAKSAAGDDARGGDTAEASLSAATIVPTTAYSFSELSIQLNQAVAAAIPAGETTRVLWSVNGQPAAEGESLPPHLFSRGDEIEARVERVAQDGSRALLAQARTTIANSPPLLRSVEVQSNPDNPGTVEAIVRATDPDGDSVLLEYQWSVEGNPVADATAPSFPVQQLARGQSLTVSVIATDGRDASQSLNSSAYSFENHPPVFDVVDKGTISRPANGPVTLTCPLQISDPDNDPVTIDFPDKPANVVWDATAHAVVWTPEPGLTNLSVTVRASDGKGGESQRRLALAL